MPLLENIQLHLPLLLNQVRIQSDVQDPHKRHVIQSRREDCLEVYTAYHAFMGVHDQHLPTFDYIVAQKNQLRLLGKLKFIKPAGLVHLDWSWKAEGRFNLEQPLDIHTSFERGGTFRQGHVLKIISELTQNDYQSQHVSQYLMRSQSNGPRFQHPEFKPQQTENVEALINQLNLERDQGRRYGLLALDLNPIHLSSTIAKLLGLKNAIAHGMYVVAQMLGGYGQTNKLTDIQSLSAHFIRPVFYHKLHEVHQKSDGLYLLDPQKNKHQILIEFGV